MYYFISMGEETDPIAAELNGVYTGPAARVVILDSTGIGFDTVRANELVQESIRNDRYYGGLPIKVAKSGIRSSLIIHSNGEYTIHPVESFSVEDLRECFAGLEIEVKISKGYKLA